MIELFNYKNRAKFCTEYLLTEGHQFYQNTFLFKYCITDLYMYMRSRHVQQELRTFLKTDCAP